MTDFYRRLVLGSLLGMAAAGTFAETYPSKPIRFVVTQPPGGSPDILARIVGTHLAAYLKTSIVIENRAGASGVTGVDLVKAAPADGYTMLLVTSTTFSAMPALKQKLSFDPDRDFEPLTRIASVANVMVVNADLGVNSVADLINLARAKPGGLNYGSAGIATPGHLAGAMFDQIAGVKTTHVPYKGAAPAINDLISGHIHYMITSPLVAMPQARAGRIKLLATAGAERDPLLPELPTIASSLSGYGLEQWWGVALPKGVPSNVVQRLHKALVTVLNAPEVKSQMNANGASPIFERPEEFVSFMKSERLRIAKVGKAAAIQLD